ncbi:hypothetical protein IFM89_026799 [Coptis chinensis]|uniref:Uncharacterized protein n=1 Tax=Coptis chinensis TaxID=261450 RepID=A0A835IYK9_9MAGN|nr:hypothetical protein IFM89_026799 [Coptis chinensis]
MFPLQSSFSSSLLSSYSFSPVEDSVDSLDEEFVNVIPLMKHHLAILAQAQLHGPEAPHGGSKKGRKVKHRNYALTLEILKANYFVDRLVFPKEDFKQRFREINSSTYDLSMPYQACPSEDASGSRLGEVKKERGNESIHLYATVDDFELSHSWKNGSVYFVGYQVEMPAEESDDDQFGSGDDSSEDDEVPPLVAAANEAHFFVKEVDIAGISLAEMIFNEIDPSLEVECFKKDGDSISKVTRFCKSLRKKLLLSNVRTLHYPTRASLGPPLKMHLKLSPQLPSVEIVLLTSMTDSLEISRQIYFQRKD